LNELEQGLELGQRCLSLAVVASAVLLSQGLPLPTAAGLAEPGPSYWLTYTAEGLPQDVDAEIALVQEMLYKGKAPDAIQVEDFSGTQLWEALLGDEPGARIKVRSGVAPKDLAAYVQSQKEALAGKSVLIDIASGFVYAAANPESLDEAQAWLEPMRQAALQRGGYTLVVDMPAAWSDRIERFGYIPQALSLMQDLKALWDPAGILNPGAFILGENKATCHPTQY
jgi:FAD/FMN-containing dehydrogenase